MSASTSKAIVLLSGGLDSVTNFAIACKESEVVLAITFDYGQKARLKEIQAARKFADWAKVKHQVLELRWLGELGGNALTAVEEEIPDLLPENLDLKEKAEQTAKQVWVPNRNGVLINAAAAFAERMGAERLIVGFNREEAATFSDNSIEYLEKVNESLKLSTRTGVEVHSYTATWDKVQMVRYLRDHFNEFPFDWVWSCYKGGESRCEKCESCRRFKRALGNSL